MSFLSSPTVNGSPAASISPRAICQHGLSVALVRLLSQLGVERSFGVIGGAISPFCHALSESPIAYHHFRHEAGAAFAALEASLATRRPVVVFTTTGPGLTNALTGLMAAHWDGGHVILISASTSPAHRGRLATQETGIQTVPSSLFLPGAPFHFATTLDHPDQLPGVAVELARGCRRKEGFVAHVSLPISIQNEPVAPLALTLDSAGLDMPPPADALARAAELLPRSRFVIWLGFGARHAAGPIRALAERAGAPVMVSPRAKGIFPEDHPLYLGVTGAGGHPEIDDILARDPPEYVLVLGTRMGESTSFWSPALAPTTAFIHVDVDPRAFGRAYPGVPCHPVQADVDTFVRSLLAAWPPAPPRPMTDRCLPAPGVPAPRAEGPVRPAVLLAAIQRLVVDGSDAWIMAESGNSLCWAAHCLRFKDPGRYRGSTGFASMGHAATGVVGAALARGGRAVALLGDGAMLMSSEVSSAVQYGARAIWIVLNDAGYLMCEQGMSTIGWTPFGTRIPRADFAALARAVGASGVNVRSEHALEDALNQALAADGPFVVDVEIDRSCQAPSGRRTRSIMQQGFDREAGER